VRIPWPTTWTWISLAAVGFGVWGLVSDPGRSTDPEAMFDPKAGTTEKLRAAEYWISQGTAAAPRMITALQDRHEDVRSQAAYVLGRIGPQAKQALPALVERLRDDSAKVRGSALYALLQVSADRNDVAAQAGGLLADKDAYVRETASEVLTECGEAALPGALRLTSHESPHVREAALRLLSRIAADRSDVQGVARLHLTDANAGAGRRGLLRPRDRAAAALAP
jgi:HEAT repeat protein